MTDRAKLERKYRHLLAWYPRSFRRENGQEILAVLMACAPDGQRRPGLAESADLIRNGLWMRLRPSLPRSAPTVRAAVRVMYVGALVSAVNLGILLVFIGDVLAAHAVLGYRLTPAQVSHLNLDTQFLTLAIVSDLIPIVLWLWMARANGQGRNWARSLSMVLFGLATLDLTGAAGTPGINIELVPVLFGPTIPVLTWLLGLAAVWLLWRPASTAFFKPHGLTQSGHSGQPSSRTGSSGSGVMRPF
jgi:hypothetical protein